MRLYKILDAITGKIEKMYPIGSVYISTLATNPAESLGFGTWEKIEGRFLVAAGQVGANTSLTWGEVGDTTMGFVAGEKGGYTNASLPTHTHEQASHGHTIGSHSHALTPHTHTIAPHNHAPGSGQKFLCYSGTYSGDNHSGLSGSGYTSPTLVQGAGTWYSSGGTAANANGGLVTNSNDEQRTEAEATTAAGTIAINQPAGTAPEGKNIPPFFGVYVWQRTA